MTEKEEIKLLWNVQNSYVLNVKLDTLVYKKKFKVDCKASYPNLLWSISTVHSANGIILIFWKRSDSRVRTLDQSLYVERQALKYLKQFYNVFGMTRCGRTNRRSSAHVANSTADSPLRKSDIFALV